MKVEGDPIKVELHSLHHIVSLTALHLLLLNAPCTLPPLSLSRHLYHAHAPWLANILDIMEANLGTKLLALPRLGDDAVKLVNLFEGKTLGLIDHEVDEGYADKAEATPDEEHAGLQVGIAWAVVDHVGRGVGDGEVEQPVGCGRHGQTLRTNLQWEQLTGDNPGDWTP